MNPLGHHGDSENYFVLIKEHGVAYDHKYPAAYNALTYLLCEAGERRASAPMANLTTTKSFAAWLHATERGTSQRMTRSRRARSVTSYSRPTSASPGMSKMVGSSIG